MFGATFVDDLIIITCELKAGVGERRAERWGERETETETEILIPKDRITGPLGPVQQPALALFRAC